MNFPEDYINKIICGDCLEAMKDFPAKSIDMILCDLPYGTTACSWDTVIPFEPLWAQYKRIIKDGGAIVLSAAQPFTSALVMSNPRWFKYEWIWEKDRPTNFNGASYSPMRYHESILVFSEGRAPYYPQMQIKPESNKRNNKESIYKSKHSDEKDYHYHSKAGMSDVSYPSTILFFNRPQDYFHPTQKPVDLFGYLIRTYTNEGDLVLDNCAGSGTTGVAAKQLKRNFILIEKEEKYCQIAERRLRMVNPIL